VELIDELTGHKNAVCCITIANDHLYTGSYDMTVRSWSIDDIHGRLMIRRRMLMEEDYSIKAEAYKCVLDAKKKKRKGKSKSPGKGAKAKAPATPAIKPKPAIQPSHSRTPRPSSRSN
jgi:WD40 repeat protein